MEKFKDMASLNEKFDGIARNASLLVRIKKNYYNIILIFCFAFR